MSVDPDDADVGVNTRVAEDGADCDAVVAADHQALVARFQRLLHRVGYLPVERR